MRTRPDQPDQGPPPPPGPMLGEFLLEVGSPHELELPVAVVPRYMEGPSCGRRESRRHVRKSRDAPRWGRETHSVLSSDLPEPPHPTVFPNLSVARDNDLHLGPKPVWVDFPSVTPKNVLIHAEDFCHSFTHLLAQTRMTQSPIRGA